MSNYLFQLSYTASSWAAQLKEPTNRVEAVKPVMDRLGGRITAAYYAFGEDDLVFIAEFPSNVNAAAASVAFSAGGAIKSIRMTPLMTVDDGIAALRKAGEVAPAYKPQR